MKEIDLQQCHLRTLQAHHCYERQSYTHRIKVNHACICKLCTTGAGVLQRKHRPYAIDFVLEWSRGTFDLGNGEGRYIITYHLFGAPKY